MNSNTGKEVVVNLEGDLFWVESCYPLKNSQHLHVSVYLIEEADSYIVIDSGAFYHRESIKKRLKSISMDKGVGALILSHADYPHAANISAFREEWGDIEIIASSGVPEI